MKYPWRRKLFASWFWLCLELIWLRIWAFKTEAAWIFDYQMSHQRTTSIAWNTIAQENSSLSSRDSKTNSWQIVMQWPLFHSESPWLLNAVWNWYIFIAYGSYWPESLTVTIIQYHRSFTTIGKQNGMAYPAAAPVYVQGVPSFMLVTFLYIVLQAKFHNSDPYSP
jgi:hypothetical protein